MEVAILAKLSRYFDLIPLPELLVQSSTRAFPSSFILGYLGSSGRAGTTFCVAVEYAACERGRVIVRLFLILYSLFDHIMCQFWRHIVLHVIQSCHFGDLRVPQHLIHHGLHSVSGVRGIPKPSALEEFEDVEVIVQIFRTIERKSGVHQIVTVGFTAYLIGEAVKRNENFRP